MLKEIKRRNMQYPARELSLRETGRSTTVAQPTEAWSLKW